VSGKPFRTIPALDIIQERAALEALSRRGRMRNSGRSNRMKKQAREQAQVIFLDANGKISNVDIAKKVGVNPLTVGKWKKADGWTAKLTAKPEKKAEKAAPIPARKKGAQDQALKLYLKSEGKITNAQLASKVGVSPSSIANWKRGERWAEKVTKPKAPLPPAPARARKQAKPPEVPKTPTAEEIEIDLDKLACPHHVNLLNKRIDGLLNQEHLSPTDLKTLGEAKEAVLGVVSAYIDIVERWPED
jgi:hypothetical protein